ncbi:hypothetical protein [Bacillus paramycoides]|uniref:hypothetical protein n=1 Tax=Bacillus paramycoides TaxID=2026194 RepID=UPI000BFCFE0B|nr:hypothetical protein [Bacillus paramycoides]MED0963192.1 hypothetical protein [Bacillus paramycoides]PGM55613.1 hypothetical protein CN947_25080 [Bacillus cereus]
MKKIIGLIASLFLLFSNYVPTFTEAAEVLNKVGWVREKESLLVMSEPFFITFLFRKSFTYAL